MAKQSIKEIAIYVRSTFSEALSKKVVAGIHREFDLLAAMPNIGCQAPKLPEGVRFLRHKQDKIYYRILEDRVQIIIVWDGRQDPNRVLDLILDFICANK